MQRPVDVDRYFQGEADSIRKETAHVMLNGQDARSRSLYGAGMIRRLLDDDLKSKMRKGDTDLMCSIAADAATRSLCRFKEMENATVTEFCRFIGGSVFFKMLLSTFVKGGRKVQQVAGRQKAGRKV